MSTFSPMVGGHMNDEMLYLPVRNSPEEAAMAVAYVRARCEDHDLILDVLGLAS